MTTAAPNTNATKIENKIPDINNLTTKTSLNTKFPVVKSKATGIFNITTRAAPTTKSTENENRIPITSGDRY